MTKLKLRRLISAVMVVTLVFGCLLGTNLLNAATMSQGTVLTRYDFDYAPSVMYGDGSQIKMWWGGGTGSGDGIYYSTASSSGWSSPVKVMQKSSSGWDSYHTCDPSVIKGSFRINGTNYSYAMYYTGSNNAVGYNSRIGVAFSNNGTSWTKYGTPVINSTENADGQYGVGMQSAYISSSGLITMMYFDSTTQQNYMVTSTDGVNFSGKTELPKFFENEHSGDIAYSPDEEKWYVSTKDGSDTKIYLYETTTSSLSTDWTFKGTISQTSTGKLMNHNPGWLRYPNGDIYIESGTEYKYVYYGSGSASTATWDIAMSIYTTGWEFNAAGNRQGWTSTNMSNDNGPMGNIWTFVTSKNDPYITSPDFEAPASAFSKVSVKIANQNTNTEGKIYFKTAEENYYSEDKSVSFECTEGGGWFTHKVKMTTNPKWKGTITGIRVDPVSSGTGGSLGIDYVRLAK